MKPIVFHPDAEAELDEAMAYYEDQRVGLGLRLKAEVENALALIQQQPQLHHAIRRLTIASPCWGNFLTRSSTLNETTASGLPRLLIRNADPATGKAVCLNSFGSTAGPHRGMEMIDDARSTGGRWFLNSWLVAWLLTGVFG